MSGAKKTFWNKEPKAFKDKKHIAWLKSQPCMVCEGIAGGFGEVEAHHLKHKSIKGRDDRFTIPLCSEHHRGSTLSPHGTPKKWEGRFPISAMIGVAMDYYNRGEKERWQ